MPEKIEKQVEELKKMFEHAEDWETKKTSIPGIFIAKMPKKDELRLYFNPPDEEGKPSKRKGFYFITNEEVDAARKAFNDGKVNDLVEVVKKYNGHAQRKTNGDDEVFSL